MQRPVKGYLFRGHDSCRVEVIDGGPGAHSTSAAVDHDPQQLGGQGTPVDTTHSRAVEDGLPVALPGTKRLLGTAPQPLSQGTLAWIPPSACTSSNPTHVTSTSVSSDVSIDRTLE